MDRLTFVGWSVAKRDRLSHYATIQNKMVAAAFLAAM